MSSFMKKSRIIFLACLILLSISLNVSVASELKDNTQVLFAGIAREINIGEIVEPQSSSLDSFWPGLNIQISVDSPTKKLHRGYDYNLAVIIEEQGSQVNNQLYTVRIRIQDVEVFAIKTYNNVILSEFTVPGGMKNKLIENAIPLNESGTTEGNFEVIIDDQVIYSERIVFAI